MGTRHVRTSSYTQASCPQIPSGWGFCATACVPVYYVLYKIRNTNESQIGTGLGEGYSTPGTINRSTVRREGARRAGCQRLECNNQKWRFHSVKILFMYVKRDFLAKITLRLGRSRCDGIGRETHCCC